MRFHTWLPWYVAGETYLDSMAKTTQVKEALRWRTVTILAGIPHANTVDLDYQGYHFLAGTNFTSNMWAIHRHPRDFPDPDRFMPERFLEGEDSAKQPYPNKYGMNPFGWGRRQCSGQPLAEQGLFYSLARMMWAFDILPGLDEHVGLAKSTYPSRRGLFCLQILSAKRSQAGHIRLYQQ